MTLTGNGLHTNAEVTLVLRPAEPDTGIVFVRTDLPGQARIPAGLSQIVNEGRRTTLKAGEGEVHTIEHLMSSLYALGVDNVEVERLGK